MKNWSWKTWVQVIVFAVILLAALVGVTYAVIQHYRTLGTDDHFSHNENGWLGWCPAMGTYVDAPTDGCPAPGWDHTPIVIAATTTNPYPPEDPERVVRRVVDRINSDIGKPVLVYDDEAGGLCSEAQSICVHIGEAAEPGWLDPGGDARHSADPDGLRCEVRTSNTGQVDVLFYVTWHEVLHCLGLAHDTWNGSIMRARQSSPADLRDAPRLSDHDRALLRDRYAE